jgi:hypothetical protein
MHNPAVNQATAYSTEDSPGTDLKIDIHWPCVGFC